MKKTISFLRTRVANILGAIVFLILPSVVSFVSHKNAEKAFTASTSLAMIGAVGGAKNRSLYEKAKARFPTAGVVSQSYLRAEQLLTNGSQEYTFNFKKTTPVGSLTEHLLNEQDAFFITHLGVFLLAENRTVKGIDFLQTYPNPEVFANESGYLQTQHLNYIYNGYLYVKIGDTPYFPDIPVASCRVVHTAQKQAAGSGFGGTANSEHHPHDGFVELSSNIDLKGRANNEIKLKVPGTANQVVQSNVYDAKVVLILSGFLATGAGNI